MPAWPDLFDMLQPRGAAPFSCGVTTTKCQRCLAKRSGTCVFDASPVRVQRAVFAAYSLPEPVLSLICILCAACLSRAADMSYSTNRQPASFVNEGGRIGVQASQYIVHGDSIVQ
jgi:hypothetical protein